MKIPNNQSIIKFNHPPLSNRATYDDIRKLIYHLKNKYNIKNEIGLKIALSNLKKLELAENYPLPLLKAYVKFIRTPLKDSTKEFSGDGTYETIPYLDNLDNTTKMTRKEIEELVNRLKKDFPDIGDIPVPVDDSIILERKKKILQTVYFIIEQEKNEYRPLQGGMSPFK